MDLRTKNHASRVSLDLMRRMDNHWSPLTHASHSGWPLSRQCEIPWQFHDISLMVRDTPAHVKCYSYHAGTSVIVSGGARNATVHDPKPTKIKRSSSAKSGMEANIQLTINSFRPLFPNKIFSLTIPWLLVKSLTFPWQRSNSLTFPGFPGIPD